ncbi:MAG: NADH:ubiquinone oxidoreductase subunit 5 (Chain L)/multisubunit Na+/H+ antiporter, MnhA subunit [Halomonadaceae bacterium T82-2]|nr:MAG: NADH:ubiquinone oxidoreductase subunit 5 (Chain L)/multisubunit Na+/H+ antiporter, MnhA subunit [Halomonadaceae bacterium T82-2]
MLWVLVLGPLLLAILVYLAGRRCGRAALTLGASLGMLATLLLALVAVMGDWQGAYRWSETLVLSLELSSAGRLFAVMVPLVALPIIAYAGVHDLPRRDDHHRTTAGGARLLALLVAFVGAMQLLVLANDLLTLLIAWELIGACSWALISQRWGEVAVARDAAHAFLTTRFGDLGLYIAAAAVFAGTGSFGYTDLAALDGGLKHVAVAGIVLAAAAKSAQLPFSAWLFAAMSGPIPVSALLHAATLVAAGLYLLARLQPALATVAWFAPVVIATGLATALAGGVVGALQGHAKKLLAASTSAQYGLMWLAVGVGFPGVALVHFVAHSFLKAGLFLATGIAERQTGSYTLADMRLGRRLPGIAIATAVMALALAGLAPMGFAWSKEQVVAAAGQQGAWLALLVALTGGLSALYATRFQWLAYGRATRRESSGLPDAPSPSTVERVTLMALAAATLLLSLLWWPAAQAWLTGALALSLPQSHPWQLVVSLILVVLGIAAGVMLARRPEQAVRGWQALAANWFGLPVLAQGIATRVNALGHALARIDDAVVDAGLRATARLARWLARHHAREGESLAEELPRSLSRLVDEGGRWARQAQSGQTHHYYTGIAAGLVIILLMLVIGVAL